MHQPAVAIVDAAGPVGVRHQSIEPQEQSHREYHDAHEYGAADPDGADRLGPEWSHHQGVHQSHCDPADLGDDNRHGQRGHRPEFLSDVVEGRDHRRDRMISQRTRRQLAGRLLFRPQHAFDILCHMIFQAWRQHRAALFAGSFVLAGTLPGTLRSLEAIPWRPDASRQRSDPGQLSR